MSYEILSTSDAQRWNEAASRCRGCDVYFSAEYHHSFELNGSGKAVGFLINGENTFFYPFMIRPIDRVGNIKIDGGWCDLETVYGYSGPLATTSEPFFLEEAWTKFDSYCRSARVVAEFIRYNPLSKNHELASRSTKVYFDRPTVVMDLVGSEKEFWDRCPSVQRNMVRKAEKRGLEARQLKLATGLYEFRTLYEETMRRLDARSFYFFNDAYYDCVAREMSESSRVLAVFDGKRMAASGLFLRDGDRFNYHLSASEEGYRSHGAVNFLLHHAALLAREMGCRWLHLGGGRTPNPDDSLLAFKARVSRLRSNFYTGRRVCDLDEYNTLNALWEGQAGGCTRSDYFLLYRAPLPGL